MASTVYWPEIHNKPSKAACPALVLAILLHKSIIYSFFKETRTERATVAYTVQAQLSVSIFLQCPFHFLQDQFVSTYCYLGQYYFTCLLPLIQVQRPRKRKEGLAIFLSLESSPALPPIANLSKKKPHLPLPHSENKD